MHDMPSLKPEPLFPTRVRKPCPICGVASYSRDGIHPQCAVQLADQPRNTQLRLKKQAKARAEQTRQRTWEKQCPKCKIQIHVRRGRCNCGYIFTDR